jgi:hypothetical protein
VQSKLQLDIALTHWNFEKIAELWLCNPESIIKRAQVPLLRKNKNVDEGRAVTHIRINMTGPSARKRTGRSSFVSHLNGLR